MRIWSTLIPWSIRRRPSHTRPRIDFRKMAPTSSQRAPISKLTIFAPYTDSRFCSAVGNANSLSQMLGVLHTRTAGWINRLNATRGRKVWHNFWDTRLTYPKSYLARLNYVHQNAVKHGLARVANQYRWCSASWFEGVASPAMVQSIYGFKTDALSVSDDFAPIVDSHTS